MLNGIMHHSAKHVRIVDDLLIENAVLVIVINVIVWVVQSFRICSLKVFPGFLITNPDMWYFFNANIKSNISPTMLPLMNGRTIWTGCTENGMNIRWIRLKKRLTSHPASGHGRVISTR